MLEVLLPLLIALAVLLPAVPIAMMLRRWHPRWWRFTLVRSLVWSLPALGLGCLAVGEWAPRFNYDPSQTPLAALVFLSLTAQLALTVSLPLSELVARIGRRPPPRPFSAKNAAVETALRAESNIGETGPTDEVAGPPDRSFSSGRRRFLQTAAAGIPLLAVGSTGVAVAGTLDGARIRRVRLEYAGLPIGLDGLRILQISDLHLGTFSTLPQLGSTLLRARDHQPHLVAVTGDIANDLRLLPAAMAMISALDPPLGVFVCLGNHDYFVGVDRVRDLLAGTPGTLLLNFGMPLTWQGVDLFIAGVDDRAGRPAGQRAEDYLRDSISLAMRRRRPWQFSILLSHRPAAFGPAAAERVDLTLAGHTHGGQVGLFGRSIMDLFPHKDHSWGVYTHGNRKLYTSCGAGQWLPFRLGCPAEAPLIELVRTARDDMPDAYAG